MPSFWMPSVIASSSGGLGNSKNPAADLGGDFSALLREFLAAACSAASCSTTVCFVSLPVSAVYTCPKETPNTLSVSSIFSAAFNISA